MNLATASSAITSASGAGAFCPALFSDKTAPGLRRIRPRKSGFFFADFPAESLVKFICRLQSVGVFVDAVQVKEFLYAGAGVALALYAHLCVGISAQQLFVEFEEPGAGHLAVYGQVSGKPVVYGEFDRLGKFRFAPERIGGYTGAKHLEVKIVGFEHHRLGAVFRQQYGAAHGVTGDGND